jgi:protein-S-isoprenylcysteine O-methyltransferase Ste14
LDHAVVDPEERYLARKFGDAYRAYSDAVPRWF